jgi:DNA mismatch repair protein MutL
MVGKFPACALYITLPNGLVDVNVHPTKAEVKFSREKAVFDGVYYGTLSALGGEDRLSVPTYTPGEKKTALASAPAGGPGGFGAGKAAPRQDFFRSMSAEEFRKAAGEPKRQDRAWERREPPRPAGDALRLRDSESYSAPAPAGSFVHRAEESAPPAPAAETASGWEPVEAESQTALTEEFETEPWRYIGEALKVYILVEQAGRLILIDKHAAHERALFDRIRLNEKPLMSQELLTPETLRTDPEGLRVAEENADKLERLGFRLEPFGEDSLAIRAVPADIDAAAAVPLAEELIEKLREGRSLSGKDVWERLAETVACKAAVKGGDLSDPLELKSLAERVLRGEVKYCPHGRPVSAVFTREDLDKLFGRIV